MTAAVVERALAGEIQLRPGSVSENLAYKVQKTQGEVSCAG
jgi:hypothetical protein